MVSGTRTRIDIESKLISNETSRNIPGRLANVVFSKSVTVMIAATTTNPWPLSRLFNGIRKNRFSVQLTRASEMTKSVTASSRLTLGVTRLTTGRVQQTPVMTVL